MTGGGPLSGRSTSDDNLGTAFATATATTGGADGVAAAAQSELVSDLDMNLRRPGGADREGRGVGSWGAGTRKRSTTVGC